MEAVASRYEARKDQSNGKIICMNVFSLFATVSLHIFHLVALAWPFSLRALPTLLALDVVQNSVKCLIASWLSFTRAVWKEGTCGVTWKARDGLQPAAFWSSMRWTIHYHQKQPMVFPLHHWSHGLALWLGPQTSSNAIRTPCHLVSRSSRLSSESWAFLISEKNQL